MLNARWPTSSVRLIPLKSTLRVLDENEQPSIFSPGVAQSFARLADENGWPHARHGDEAPPHCPMPNRKKSPRR